MPTDLNRRRLLLGSTALAGAYLVQPLSLIGKAYAETPRPDHLVRAVANENPYGPSRVALQAVSAAMKQSNLYGGITSDLISLQSAIEDVPADSITVGTGSGEILNVSGMIAGLEPGSIVTPNPTYAALLRYAQGFGAELIQVPVDDNLHIDLDAMYSAIRSDTRMVYLCNPNNPVPAIIEKNALEDFVLEVSRDRLVFIDEAYYEYVDNPQFKSMMHLVADGHPNIIVARTASKIHGIAGLRVGFGYAHPDLIRVMNEKKTGSLNILGQHAAYASYQDMEFQDFSRRKNRESKLLVENMCDELGIRYVPSNTNFCFLETGIDISDFSAMMLDEGVAVGRPFPPYRTWARISLQKPEEMAYFVQTYKKLMG